MSYMFCKRVGNGLRLALMGYFLLGFSLAAQAAGRTYILNVEQRAVSSRSSSRSASLAGIQMPKFLTERAVEEEVFTVRWKTPPDGLAAGVLALFEYKQRQEDGVRNLHIQYPFRVTGERTSVFVIPERIVRQAGPVAEWRVRIVQKGRLLAERRSAFWK